MKKILLIPTILLLFAGTAFADFTTGTWQFKKAVTGLPSVPSGGFVKVDLDREVSTGAMPDLRDIRVIANDKDETPFQLVTESEAVRNEYLTTALSDLSSQAGETMFTLDLGTAGLVHDHLSILSDSKNFKRVVRVYAADTPLALSSSNWRLLTDKGYIYNFNDRVSGFDAGSGEVSYPQNSSRYLKVVIGAGEGSDVSVSSAHVLRLSMQSAKEDQFLITANIAHDPTHKTSEITLDLGGSGIPTHRLTLATNDPKNFSRRAIVEESNDDRTWSSIGDGYVFSLATPLFTGSELGISYRETQARYLRVLIIDQDDAAVAWEKSVRLEGASRAVVFQATPGNSYALYYGNKNAYRPEYDLSRYFQYVESTGLIGASLAAQEMNSGFLAPPAQGVPIADRTPNILRGVLILLVAVITFLLISYLKKLKLTDRGTKGG